MLGTGTAPWLLKVAIEELRVVKVEHTDERKWHKGSKCGTLRASRWEQGLTFFVFHAVLFHSLGSKKGQNEPLIEYKVYRLDSDRRGVTILEGRADSPQL